MSPHDESSSADPSKRWYDADPALQRAMAQLRAASDQHQAQIALNIIKIIVEHQMEDETSLKVEDLQTALPYGDGSWEDQQQQRRWYDVHETLSSAIQLLLDCPADLKERLIPSIIQVIENTLARPKD
jgi:hypothetical protein